MISQAGRLDYTMDRGGVLEDVLTWSQDGNPIDLTEFSASLVISTGDRPSDVVLTKELDVTPITGAIYMNITSAESVLLSSHEYLYSVVLTSPDATVYLVAGLLHVLWR